MPLIFLLICCVGIITFTLGEDMQLAQLSSIVNEMSVRITQLEKESLEKDEKLQTLETKTSKAIKELAKVKSTAVQQQLIIFNLKNEVGDLSGKVNGHPASEPPGHKNAQDAREPTRVDRIKDVHEDKMVMIKRNVSPFVAFHTTITSNIVVPAGAIIVYNNEELDIGNGYSPQDGIYIVPITGTYVISWIIMCDGHNYYSTRLIVNGHIRGYAMADSEDSLEVDSATGLVVLRLNANDHVFIRVYRSHGYVYGTGKYWGRSSFSGWLLQ